MQNEDEVYRAVQMGEFMIDAQGQVWRTVARRADRWRGGSRAIPCAPRRAENKTGLGYLQVRTMLEGRRYHALAHRLVYRHFKGPIQPGLTINHKNGQKDDNRPDNLEAATYSEQAIHARTVLRRGRLEQGGAMNPMAKLTAEDVVKIRARRAAGEKLRAIAADFGVTDRAVSKIARGHRWAG